MKKKQIDYVFLLTFMILSYITGNVLPKLFPGGMMRSLIDSSTTLVIFGWYIFMYRVTSNFYENKWIRRTYAALLVFQLSFMGLVHSPGHTIADYADLATISYVANLIGFGWMFYLLLRDIFSQKHDLTYSLLGASNIYVMIPLLFTYVFSLVSVHSPALIHANPNEIFTVILNSSDYSWYVISGLDYPGEKVAEEIQSIAILESVTGNLFIVFIIGRLLSK